MVSNLHHLCSPWAGCGWKTPPIKTCWNLGIVTCNLDVFFCDVVCLRNPEDLFRKDMLFCWFHLKFLTRVWDLFALIFRDWPANPFVVMRILSRSCFSSQGKTHAWQVRECGVSHLPGFCILWHNHILHPCKLLCCHRCSSCNLIFQPPTTSTTIELDRICHIFIHFQHLGCNSL